MQQTTKNDARWIGRQQWERAKLNGLESAFFLSMANSSSDSRLAVTHPFSSSNKTACIQKGDYITVDLLASKRFFHTGPRSCIGRFLYDDMRKLIPHSMTS